MITIKAYDSSLKDIWNEMVARSKNGTFLLDRNFMDYHHDRFADASLLFFNDKGKTIAALPANYDSESKTVWSHQGLTYGGLICGKDISAVQVFEALDLALDHYRSMGATIMNYKPIPYIYNTYPCEEDLYYLFRHDARLISCGISQTIDLQNPIKLKESRKSGLRKAAQNEIQIAQSNDVAAYWNILADTLMKCHGTKPVHSVEELKLLMARFPEQIKLYVANNKNGEILAGTIIFDFGETIHTQYMAASEEGKQKGALDLLIECMISEVYADRHYFDFGISTEQNGQVLNEGLLFQKESFGGRSVCYNIWQLNL